MYISEPAGGVVILQTLNARVSASEDRFHNVSFWADAIVLLFPLILICLYVYGMQHRLASWKEYALRIFFSPLVAVLINIIVQGIFEKIRPETALTTSSSLMLHHLPTMSFPSDHAAVGMAFAYAIMYFACIKKLVGISPIRALFSLGMVVWLGVIVMSISRVAVGVHRPTDIFVGWIVGVIAVGITGCFPSWWFHKIIQLQEVVWKGILKKLHMR